MELCNLVTQTKDKYKKLSKQQEKLSKVKEMSYLLNNCHIQLNQTLHLMENLNNTLPLDYRLEPFVWTTG
jgi:Leucine-rich repeat (LRR) protein